MTREERRLRAKVYSAIFFYILLFGAICPAAYFSFLGSSIETKIEGQVIPPSGTSLQSEVWVVSELPDLSGYSQDLISKRAPDLQKMSDLQDKLNRVKQDAATRTERLRILQGQQDDARQQIAKLVAGAKDSASSIWGQTGTSLDQEHDQKLAQVKADIQQHADALKIDYQTDDSFPFPDAWANAFKLAMYGVPSSPEKVKELKWLDGELTQWHTYETGFYSKKAALKDQVSQALLSSSQEVSQINQQVDDLNRKINEANDDLQPILHEQEQDQTDMNTMQSTLLSYEPEFMQELSIIPGQNILKHLPVDKNGRFTWKNEEKDQKFAEGEKFHRHWLFFRAIRDSDGREFWALAQVIVMKNDTLNVVVLPGTFANLRSILRPDLPPSEL